MYLNVPITSTKQYDFELLFLIFSYHRIAYFQYKPMNRTQFEHLLSILKKVIHYTLSLLFIGILILALVHPSLFKEFLGWIGHIVGQIGLWNYGLVALSGIAESLPVIGVIFPGQNIVIIVGSFF